MRHARITPAHGPGCRPETPEPAAGQPPATGVVVGSQDERCASKASIWSA